MAYSNRFRSVLNDNFKILTWVLILFIAITPNFIFMQSANAANLGGWQVGTTGYQSGGRVGLEAVKQVMLNAQQHTKRSKTSLSVPAARIAKVLAGGGAAVALAEAVTALIGAGVDWILDPVNNSVVYTVLDDPTQPDPTSQYVYRRVGGYATLCGRTYHVKNAASMRTDAISCYTSFRYSGSVTSVVTQDATIYVTIQGSNGRDIAVYSAIANPAYDPNAQEEEQRKSIPLETVAQEVISQADAGSDAAARAVEAAADDILNEAEKDDAKARPITNALEANASTTTTETSTGTATKPNTAEPDAPADVTDIALEFPVFCGWAPIVCEAAQVAISFPSTIAAYVAEFWSFVREEAAAENAEVTVYEDTNIIFDDSQRVNLPSSCPAPEQFSVSFFASSQNLEFSYEPLCNFMSMIRPFVIAGSYLIGAYIIMGLSRGSAE